MNLSTNKDNKIVALNYIKEQIITCAIPPALPYRQMKLRHI